jgi:hypothetical protein
MKSKKITLINRLLTLLGIGTSAMLFVACYGAAPRGYAVIDDEDSISVVMGDSVAATFDMATNDTEPAAADSEKTDQE